VPRVPRHLQWAEEACFHLMNRGHNREPASAEYHELASAAQDREERWRGFLLGEDPREPAVRRGDWVIGDDAFRLQVSQARGRPVPRGRGRPRKSSKPGQVQLSP